MSASGLPNAQARKLLQTLGKFIMTLAKSVNTKDEKEVDDLMLGVEATEFVTELEKFISSSQHRKKGGSMEVTSGSILFNDPNDPVGYLEGTDWFWDISHTAGQHSSSPSEKDETGIAFEGSSENRTTDYSILYHRLATHGIQNLPDNLVELRKQITTFMPIHVLHVEPAGSKLKISLLDRNAVYEHLSKKLCVDFNTRRRISSQWIPDHTRYAILSHTWKQTPGELTYIDWQSGLVDSDDPRSQKLLNFCRAIWENHGLNFGWIDTVCINKDSSSELDESIRSMYKWYRNAEVCITYLAETNSLLEMHDDNWFTRGWTFQELVAPRVVKFYNKDWERLVPFEINDKNHHPILESIRSATKITPDELCNIDKVPISRRMELAAQRKVTREEDTAYSLMGIFHVSLSTAYGEGAERAFFRLLKEIFDTSKDSDISDIFNCSSTFGSSSMTSLFPRYLFEYANRSTNPELRPWRPIEPLTLTHLGLRTPILLMATELCSELDSAGHKPIGDYHATVSVELVWEGEETYFLLQNKDFTNAMGTLNVEEDDDGHSIRIRKACFAVLLEEQDGPNNLGRYLRRETEKPIVFTLKKVSNADDEGKGYYVVRKDQLEYHGMKLVTLHL